MKTMLMLPALLALAGCKAGPGTTVDLTPVADGLNFLGFCIVLGVLLAVIGVLIAKGGK